MTSSAFPAGKYSVEAAAIAAVEKAVASVPAFRSTKLWAIDCLGIVPVFVSTILRVSPGAAWMAVTSNFIASFALISMVRGPAAAAGLAAAVEAAGTAAESVEEDEVEEGFE